MSKVYLYHQKFFKQLAVLIVMFGVVSCATSNSTAATSGETDGVYYSPSKDGQVQSAYDQPESNAYDIQVGSPYFDANGNGAEDFYYNEQTAGNTSAEDVNIYSGGSNVYVASGSTTDWGRYDGLDITINNYGWNDPWWGWGYNSWGWGWGSSWRYGWGWNNPYYGWGGWYGYSPYWGNPYWGWGGWYGYSPYWGNPYWGGGYYGYNGYYGNGYYNRGVRVNPGVRPGNYLANGTQYRNYSPYRSQNNQGLTSNRPIRNGNSTVRNGNISSENTPVRPVRDGIKENPRNSVDMNTGNTPVRNTRNGEIISNSENNVRPVRQTAPDNVRPNTPIRTNQNIRTNSNIRNNGTGTNPNIRSNSNTRPNSNVNSNSGMRSNSNSNSSMRSGNTSGGMRSGSSSTGGVRSGGRR